MKLIKETIRKKGEQSALYSKKKLDHNEIILDYAAENATDDCSAESLLTYAEDYNRRHPIEEGDRIFIGYMYKGSIGNEPTYFFGCGIECKRQNDKIIIIGRHMGV